VKTDELQKRLEAMQEKLVALYEAYEAVEYMMSDFYRDLGIEMRNGRFSKHEES
jgi:hypothetical protein